MEKKKWSQPKLLSLNNKETAAGTTPGRAGDTTFVRSYTDLGVSYITNQRAYGS